MMTSTVSKPNLSTIKQNLLDKIKDFARIFGEELEKKKKTDADFVFLEVKIISN